MIRRSAYAAFLVTLAVAACARNAPRQTARPGTGGQGQAQTPPVSQVPPALPDSAGFGTHVLVVSRPTGRGTWVGTYGHGIFALRRGAKTWDNIASRDNDSTSISWNFVNALGFPRDSSIWYGTVGNGFGRSRDDGKTWQNWGLRQLGKQWQYVAPEGIRTRGDTVYIATADGLRLTWDGGSTWRCVQSAAEANSTANDGCSERITTLPNKYLLALDVGPDGSIWVGHLQGLAVSRDAGRTWRSVTSADGRLKGRVRAITVAQARPSPQQMMAEAAEQAAGGVAAPQPGQMPGGEMRAPGRRERRSSQQETADSSVWVATEDALYRGNYAKEDFKVFEPDVPGFTGINGAPRSILLPLFSRQPAFATSRGFVAAEFDSIYHVYLGSGELYRPAADVWSGGYITGRLLPIVGTSAGIDKVLPIQRRAWDLINPLPGAAPVEAKHTWFRRPIDSAEGNPYIDATYRYGSTMGGNFQQHQGVEFNNPAGTPVHAVDAGTVIFAGPAEGGANTVAIRHDRNWQGQNVYTVYYHNSSLAVRSGQHVQRGDVIARVGNTGRATNEHLHLEVHVTTSTDSSKIVHPDVRFPPFTVNPQLWVEPLQGTGIVAGQVFDAAGAAVPGARVYGIVLPYPEETPFSFAETYSDKAHSDPAYGEHFAVGDVPEGRYLLGVDIAGTRVWRTINVQAGRVTWVEFRP